MVRLGDSCHLVVPRLGPAWRSYGTSYGSRCGTSTAIRTRSASWLTAVSWVGFGAALAEPFRDASVDKVAGIEARGFALAALVAIELGAGFVAVRKPGAIHPGPKEQLQGPPDWRGQITHLQLQRHVVTAGERVLVVDDWAETGSKALTTRRLVEACGGRYVGLSLLVDQLPDRIRDELAPVARIVFAREVGAG